MKKVTKYTAKPLPPEEWQPGDVVRILSNTSEHGYEIGQEVEIISIIDQRGFYKGNGKNRPNFTDIDAEWVSRPKVNGWYAANVYPLAQKLCKADEGNQESNFGQMLELLNDLADEINRSPVETLRVILELAERRK